MRKNKRLFPISMTILWGIVYSNALHSLAMGICLGIVMGGAFGLFDSKKDESDEDMLIK